MSGSIKAWPNRGEITPDLVEAALETARDDMLESAARMVEARATLYRGHSTADPVLRAKAEEAEDIAAALRALRAGPAA